MGYYELSQQRKTEIENCLLDLMTQIPYAQITVKDLAQKLHCVRKTFYHYFPNKQACLESLIDRIIGECSQFLVQTLPEQPSLYDIYHGRLTFWMEHRAFLEALIRNDMSALFLVRILGYIRREDTCLKEQYLMIKVQCDEDVLFFFMSGELYLLLKWCGEGFTLPIEEMTQKYLRLVQEPMLSPDLIIR